MAAPTLAEALHDAFVECRDMDAALSERLGKFADAVRHLDPHFRMRSIG